MAPASMFTFTRCGLISAARMTRADAATACATDGEQLEVGLAVD